MRDSTTTSTRRFWLSIVAPAAAALLLVGMGAVNRTFPDAEDAEPYHQRIRDVIGEAPNIIGPWESRPVELPPAAIQLLRPNAHRSRSYHNPQTGEQVSFLLVQCKDARDLSGHWPPNCYKATGYTLASADDRVWEVGDLKIPGVDYLFEIFTAGRQNSMVVSNFMILPGVGFVPDMFSVREAGADPQRRHFGAAQVQVVTDAGMTEDRRRQVFDELIEAHLPLIREIADMPSPLPAAGLSASSKHSLDSRDQSSETRP